MYTSTNSVVQANYRFFCFFKSIPLGNMHLTIFRPSHFSYLSIYQFDSNDKQLKKNRKYGKKFVSVENGMEKRFILKKARQYFCFRPPTGNSHESLCRWLVSSVISPESEIITLVCGLISGFMYAFARSKRFNSSKVMKVMRGRLRCSFSCKKYTSWLRDAKI